MLYLAGAFALLAIGGIFFGNKEIGAGGGSLAMIVALGFGGFYYYHQEIAKQDMKTHMRVEEALKRRGLSISHDGRQVSDGNSWFDPLSSQSYE